jgi:hypothetical protein
LRAGELGAGLKATFSERFVIGPLLKEHFAFGPQHFRQQASGLQKTKFCAPPAFIPKRNVRIIRLTLAPALEIEDKLVAYGSTYRLRDNRARDPQGRVRQTVIANHVPPCWAAASRTSAANPLVRPFLPILVLLARLDE